jgi:hypothetical protein
MDDMEIVMKALGPPSDHMNEAARSKSLSLASFYIIEISIILTCSRSFSTELWLYST